MPCGAAPPWSTVTWAWFRCVPYLSSARSSVIPHRPCWPALLEQQPASGKFPIHSTSTQCVACMQQCVGLSRTQAVAGDIAERHQDYSVQAMTNFVWGATALGFFDEVPSCPLAELPACSSARSDATLQCCRMHNSCVGLQTHCTATACTCCTPSSVPLHNQALARHDPPRKVLPSQVC